jgi:alpha-1,2-mannosyltransferase
VKGADYIQFYLMGSLLAEGRPSAMYDSQVLAEQAQRRISPELAYRPERNPYGPQVAVAFAPLAALPYLLSLLGFTLLSLCAYATAAWLLWRSAPALRGEGTLVALSAAAFPALLTTLRFGQTSTFTLLALALAVVGLQAGRPVLAGLALGSLAYKPQLLVVALPVLFLARDWRCLSGVLAAIVIQVIVALAAGPEALVRYAQTLQEVALRPDLVMLHPENAHSLRGFLRLVGGPPAVATVVPLALALVAVPVLARRWRAGSSPLLLVGLLVLVTVLLAPHLLSYDLLLLAVPICALGDWLLGRDRTTIPALATATGLALYLAPFSSFQAAHTHVQLSTLAIGAGALVLVRALRSADAPGGTDDAEGGAPPEQLQ